jgi:hypothetical protein
MIQKATVDCEEGQRLLICAFNGLAAIQLIKGEKTGAIETYKQALSFVDKNAGVVEVDKLQRLHIYHNYSQVLKELDNLSEEQQQEIEKASQQAETLRRDFLKQAGLKTEMLQYNMNNITKKVHQLYDELHINKGAWYDGSLKDIALDPSVSRQLLSKIVDELTLSKQAYKETNASSMASKFRDISGLLMSQLFSRFLHRFTLYSGLYYNKYT